MAYNRRKLLLELDALLLSTPRIRLGEIARILHVDRHTIENAMRLTRQVSFREYRRRELVQTARTMLNESDVSVKEVGIRLGYKSAASFSRFVQKSTGRSPSKLRNDGP